MYKRLITLTNRNLPKLPLEGNEFDVNDPINVLM